MGGKARDREKTTKVRSQETTKQGLKTFIETRYQQAGNWISVGIILLLQGGGTPESSPFLSLNSIWKMIPGANNSSQEARMVTESSKVRSTRDKVRAKEQWHCSIRSN